MKVSMIPDNSVKMIHASQDDVGRRWEFELYDEDGLIDVSSVGEQMFYPVYSGGTEQILPENTSTPTTSPIIANIVYPDEERDEQEFLYRECPSVEDGQAKIKKAYGQTVKWNQILMNGNFADTSVWSSGSQLISSGKLTLPNRTDGGDTFSTQTKSFTLNHKYYFQFEAKRVDVKTNSNYSYVQVSASSNIYITSDQKTKYKATFVCTDETVNRRVLLQNGFGAGAEFYNIMLFDLTAMGKENYTAEQFEAWLSAFYPLPYYAYNQGTLLPFMGEQIKTTNADQSVESIVNLPTLDYFADGMKSAGSVFDELTENKAIQRIGDDLLASHSWTKGNRNNDDTGYIFYCTMSIPNDTEKTSAIFEYIPWASIPAPKSWEKLKKNQLTTNGNYIIACADYSDVESFMTAIANQHLYYELAEPVETPIASASLVSQNQEIPLSVEDDKLVAFSTAEVTEQSGFHDAKIKLSNDGVAYSAKFTLHVERKP